MVKKILMAIDRSGYKERITTFTISLAKALGAEVTAVHIIDRSSFEPAADAYGNYMGLCFVKYLMIIQRKIRLDSIIY
jgi:nucleotide-binding universal stress UspA family protein